MVHAAIEETARRCHPRVGAVLEQKAWTDVFRDPVFQQACNDMLAEVKGGWFSKQSRDLPSPADYEALGAQHIDVLDRWAKWPSIRAFFHCLDAEAALGDLADGPFLSELTSDIVLEELQDQVDRGYLKI